MELIVAKDDPVHNIRFRRRYTGNTISINPDHGNDHFSGVYQFVYLPKNISHENEFYHCLFYPVFVWQCTGFLVFIHVRRIRSLLSGAFLLYAAQFSELS